MSVSDTNICHDDVCMRTSFYFDAKQCQALDGQEAAQIIICKQQYNKTIK